jgi:hypothetical protein
LAKIRAQVAQGEEQAAKRARDELPGTPWWRMVGPQLPVSVGPMTITPPPEASDSRFFQELIDRKPFLWLEDARY